LACGDQRRLTGNGSALEVVLHDYALYKSTFTLLYFTLIVAQTTSLRGPIRKHEDLLKLIDMPSHASSTSHLCKRCCKRVTDGDKSNMSSAYKIM